MSPPQQFTETVPWVTREKRAKKKGTALAVPTDAEGATLPPQHTEYSEVAVAAAGLYAAQGEREGPHTRTRVIKL